MNKNTQFAFECVKKNLTKVVLFAMATVITACSIIGGFNKNKAIELIQKENKYKAPATIPINIGKRLTNAGASAPQISIDDTAEAAVIRAKEDFAKRQPQVDRCRKFRLH